MILDYDIDDRREDVESELEIIEYQMARIGDSRPGQYELLRQRHYDLECELQRIERLEIEGV